MLLHRLGIPFDCQSPEIDEAAHENEAPCDLVSRLALQKAETVSSAHPRDIIIGSDQVAVFNGRTIGKPGGWQNAFEQLNSFSGQTVEFLTAVSVLSLNNDFREQHIDRTQVHFRQLQESEIERYLEKEKSFDCAGAFKAEALGIVLFERISSKDPTALIGLPLIRTAAMLRHAGLLLP